MSHELNKTLHEVLHLFLHSGVGQVTRGIE
jgi:hypothetical protein